MTDIHQDATAALYAADALTGEEREAFERHLTGCARCQRQVHDFAETTTLLSQAEAMTPPPRLRSAILAGIAETPQESTVAFRQPPNAPDRAADRVRATSRTVRGRGWRRVPYLVAAVAVLVALAGGVWGWQAHHAAITAEQQNQLITRLLGSTDSVSRSARMTGGGRGLVIVSHDDHQAVFVGTDLPRPAAGEVYQLWTIQGQPRSAGLITAHTATIVVRLPAAALTAAAVAVTVEPAGGSPSPTEQPVMTFPLP